jgi:hypothetical protein
MKQTFQAKKLTKLGVAVGMALAALGADAAQNQLTGNTYDTTNSMNLFTLVMSTDYDYDNPPAGKGRDYIETVIKQSSKTLYTMTEGKTKLEKVYVYRNKCYWDNTDIKLLEKDGRANAGLAGFMGSKSSTNEMFAGTSESAENVGKVLAHEYGHYILGIYDEYREEGKVTDDKGAPQDRDNARDTAMHDSSKYNRLSTAEDYSVEGVTTAQYRVYGKSAWATLTNEVVPNPIGEPNRTYFSAFKNMTATPGDAASLKHPVGGENVEIVYLKCSDDTSGSTAGFAAAPSGPINVIVIDTTTSKAQLSAQLAAADQVVNAAGSNVRVAVVAFPFGHAPVVPLTSLSNSSARATVKAAIAKIAADSSSDDTTNGDRLFNWAESTLPNYFPAGGISTTGQGYYYRLYAGTNKGVGVKGGKVYYYDGKTIADIGPISQWLPQSRQALSGTMQSALDMIKAVRTGADIPTVTLFTTDTQTISSSLVSAFRSAKVAVNPVVLAVSKGKVAGRNRFTATDPDSTSLFDMAKQTSGELQESKNLDDLSRNALKSTHAADGDNFEPISEASADSLKAGASSSVVSPISGSDIDGEVKFEAFWSSDDDGNISYTLTAPDGTKITPDHLPSGITYSAEPGEESATYTVSASYAGRTGKWTSTLTASKDLVGSVSQEVGSKSSLSAIVDTMGGTKADSRGMTISVKLGNPTPVKGATVTGEVYAAADGTLVKSGLVFKDDGVLPDAHTGDGRYTASVSNLPAGDYEIIIHAGGDGTAVFSTGGAMTKGTNKPDVVIPAFQRTTTTFFKKEL